MLAAVPGGLWGTFWPDSPGLRTSAAARGPLETPRRRSSRLPAGVRTRPAPDDARARNTAMIVARAPTDDPRAAETSTDDASVLSPPAARRSRAIGSSPLADACWRYLRTKWLPLLDDLVRTLDVLDREEAALQEAEAADPDGMGSAGAPR